jgi:hypothetical protein
VQTEFEPQILGWIAQISIAKIKVFSINIHIKKKSDLEDGFLDDEGETAHEEEV